jgi:hypothetical protein
MFFSWGGRSKLVLECHRSGMSQAKLRTFSWSLFPWCAKGGCAKVSLQPRCPSPSPPCLPSLSSLPSTERTSMNEQLTINNEPRTEDQGLRARNQFAISIRACLIAIIIIITTIIIIIIIMIIIIGELLGYRLPSTVYLYTQREREMIYLCTGER